MTAAAGAKITVGALAALALLGGGALAQTTSDTDAEGTTTPPAAEGTEMTTEGAGTDPAAAATAEGTDGTPLLLPETVEGEVEGGVAEGVDVPVTEPIETDVTADGDAIEMDGTVPIDASPGAASEEEETATTVTEGGSASGEVAMTPSSDVPTDVTATGEAMNMDGTVPIDESPEPEQEGEEGAAPTE